MKKFAVGVTGASGTPIARRLVEQLLAAGCETHVTLSRAGRLVARDELGLQDEPKGSVMGIQDERIIEWNDKDWNAPFASGSSKFDGLVICPCSMSTVGAVAAGIADNLLRRGADVMLKEKRPMVLVPREAPLSEIHLENMLRVARAGGIIIPPVLTFYQGPGEAVSDQVDFIVSRILDHLGVDNDLVPRWGMT